MAVNGDVWGALAVVAAALALFAPLWATGRVWIDGDLGDFYWPTMQALFGALREGRSPLWNPNLMGGFPLFADGSVGALFPLNWVLLVAPHALMLIPFLRTLVAALGMYAFVRLVGIGPLGATVAGLVFALNSFSVSHFSHIDLNNGTAVLPWLLLAVEKSLRASSWRRLVLWLLAAGVFYGLAWLSLHPMAPLMILPVYAGWVVYRAFGGSTPLSPWGRTKDQGRRTNGEVSSSESAFVLGPSSSVSQRWLWALAALALPVAIALGLGAAQIVPMAELGSLSPRQTAGARFNASFSLPPYDLIGLVWPTFFHSAPGGPRWGLWNLETLTYLGTLPFVLALVAVAAWPRRRHVGFFVATALLALWVAFAVYAPLSPQAWLYSLPGYNVLRAPARFFYITGFAGAYLAAAGADWLIAQQWSGAAGRRVRWLLVGLAALALLIPVLGVVIVLFVNGVPGQAERAIWAFYLNLPRGTPLRYEDVVYAINQKLRPDNLELWKVVGLLWLSVALVWAWLRGWFSRPVFAAAAVLITAVDLLLLAGYYVTPAPLARVVEPRPVAEYVQAQRAADAGATLNGDRILHAKRVDPPMIDLPFGVPDFNGQSSLNMARPAAYTAALFSRQGDLAERAAVRWLMVPNGLADVRQRLNGVAFDREWPLAVVDATTPADERTFNVAQQPARELRLLLALSQAVDVPQGATVAEVTVRGADGASRAFPIRAGIEASEWAYERPDVRAAVRHAKAPPALSWGQVDETGQRFDRFLTYVELPLAEGASFTPSQLEVRPVDPRAETLLFGATIMGEVTPVAQSLTRSDLTRYTPVYWDDDVRLFETGTTLPRARLVGQGVTYEAPWQALERLTHDANMAGRVTLEGTPSAEAAPLLVPGPADPRVPLPPAPDPATLGTLRLVEDTPTRVVLAAETTSPAFLVLADTAYPGWRATVDDGPTDILTADSMFRAVYLPPGEHRVTFEYAPRSVQLGVAISLATIVALALAAGLLWRGARREV